MLTFLSKLRISTCSAPNVEIATRSRGTTCPMRAAAIRGNLPIFGCRAAVVKEMPQLLQKYGQRLTRRTLEFLLGYLN